MNHKTQTLRICNTTLFLLPNTGQRQNQEKTDLCFFHLWGPIITIGNTVIRRKEEVGEVTVMEKEDGERRREKEGGRKRRESLK